jgi:hypothetical protein
VKLTPIQRKVLLRYRGFIGRPPTPLRIFATVLPQILMLISLVILSAYTLPVTATAFCGGMCVAMVVYQVAFSVKVVKAIPTIVEFLDWKRVDHALAITENDELGPRPI